MGCPEYRRAFFYALLIMESEKKFRWDVAALVSLVIAAAMWAGKMERNTARTATGVEFFKEAFREVAQTQKEFRAAINDARDLGRQNYQRNEEQDRRLDDHQRILSTEWRTKRDEPR